MRFVLVLALLLLGCTAADRECARFCHQGMPHMYIRGSARSTGPDTCACSFGNPFRPERLRNIDLRRGRQYQQEDGE